MRVSRAAVVVLVAVLTACGGPSSPTAPSPVTPVPTSGVTLAKLAVEASVLGGQAATGTATLSAAAPQGGIVVSLTADNAAATVPTSIAFSGGETSVTFQIATRPVATTTDVTITAQAGDVRRTAALRLRIDPTSLKPSATFTIGFSALRENRAPFTVLVESGFAISTVSGPWMALTTYGNPQPFIQFNTAGGMTGTGEISVTAAGAPFWLTSVDFYSSTTRIPYVIEGFLSGEQMFSVVDVIGNTFGNFARRPSPRPDLAVDLLLIRLSNPSTIVGGSNPMGVDNIVVSR